MEAFRSSYSPITRDIALGVMTPMSRPQAVISTDISQPTDIDIEKIGVFDEVGGSVRNNMLTPKNIDVETLGGNAEGGIIKKARRGSTPVLKLEGDNTEEEPYQRAIVTAHFSVVLVNVIFAMSAILSGDGGLRAIDVVLTKVVSISATILASVVLGDISTGVFHWAVDNYGSLKTPVVGSICHAFQGHHDTPWTITFRSLANNLYKVAYGCAPSLLLLVVAPGVSDFARLFFALFINWWLLSQELHKYSHMKTTPPRIKKLMDMGLILSKKEHGLHHTAPFDSNYCILTGHNNKWMDDSKLFRHLERIVFELTGNEPNSWNESQGGADVRRTALGL